jgi:hypothetical protein
VGMCVFVQFVVEPHPHDLYRATVGRSAVAGPVIASCSGA